MVAVSMAEQKSQNIIEVVRDYGKHLFSFIRSRVNSHEDAEDILQDVWYRFSNTIETEPIAQTTAWLYRVARNRIIDKYRKQKPVSLENELSKQEDEEYIKLNKFFLPDNNTPEAEYLRNVFWEELMIALDELPAEQRQVFTWHEMEGRSFEEIAEKTGENIKTLVSRKHYAVLHLRKKLERLYNEMLNP
jgi:RNA polymerase sigma factor (sigma-70 family)